MAWAISITDNGPAIRNKSKKSLSEAGHWRLNLAIPFFYQWLLCNDRFHSTPIDLPVG